ncbi:MAG: type II secretion system F family protein [Clostridiales bacterium]|jgi:tight adherence protein C|nr:type II secretion system F family protein [Clostridiales bacterium]
MKKLWMISEKPLEESYKSFKLKLVLCGIVGISAVPMGIISGSTFIQSSLISVILLIILFISNVVLLNRKVKSTRQSFETDMPDFLDTAAMMLEAGLNIWPAIERTVVDSKNKGLLYREFDVAVKEVLFGLDPIQSLENLTRRCSALSVSSLVSVIIQNYRKGSDELITLLRAQSAICRNERKNMAAKMGEEASTLMLIPQMLVFLAILILLVTPAILQMTQVLSE